MGSRYKDLGVTIGRYYPTVSSAMVDYEVETGTVLGKGFIPILQALGAIVECVRKSDDGAVPYVARQLCEAARVFRHYHFRDKFLTTEKLRQSVLGCTGVLREDEVKLLSELEARMGQLKLESEQWEQLEWEAKDREFVSGIAALDTVRTTLDSLYVLAKSRYLIESAKRLDAKEAQSDY